MTGEMWLRRAQDALFPSPDARADARLFLTRALNVPPGRLLLHLHEELPGDVLSLCESMLARRAAGEPSQYILGEAYFMGLRFAVNPHVLIPRQDTELLAEAAIAEINARSLPDVLDLCTGSGALAVCLAKYTGAQVSASDLSADALSVAAQNSRENGVQVRFFQGDLLAPIRSAGLTFSLIVCNPPYLTAQDMGALQSEVAREPRMALDGGADGLAFYRRLTQDAAAVLKLDGRLMMEIGCAQAEAVCALFHACGYQTAVHKDLNRLDRVVVVRFS